MIEFQWANEKRINGMPTPDECERDGYVRVRQHPRWSSSWLMRRDVGDS